MKEYITLKLELYVSLLVDDNVNNGHGLKLAVQFGCVIALCSSTQETNSGCMIDGAVLYVNILYMNE